MQLFRLLLIYISDLPFPVLWLVQKSCQFLGNGLPSDAKFTDKRLKKCEKRFMDLQRMYLLSCRRNGDGFWHSSVEYDFRWLEHRN